MSAEYKALLDEVLTRGVTRHGEKPEATLTATGLMYKQDLSEGFPLLTLRDLGKSWDKIIKREILWMISGSTSAKEAEEKYGLTLWNRWAKDSEEKLGTPPGELGPVYGKQFRNWHGTTDQLTQIIHELETVRETRRGVVSMWDIEDVWTPDHRKKVNVANCIMSLKFLLIDHKLPDGNFEPRLDMDMVHRSADIPAGVPHDVPTFALLQTMIAKQLGVKPGTLTDHIMEGQIYEMQIEPVKELLKREPLPKPEVRITESRGSIYEYQPEDFELTDYVAHPSLKMPTAT